MKISLFFIGLSLSLSVLASKVEVDINGMTCGMCVKAITKELQATKKVDQIVVNLEEKKATFNELKNISISDEEIKSAVKKAGYEAVKIRR